MYMHVHNPLDYRVLGFLGKGGLGLGPGTPDALLPNGPGDMYTNGQKQSPRALTPSLAEFLQWCGKHGPRNETLSYEAQSLDFRASDHMEYL